MSRGVWQDIDRLDYIKRQALECLRGEIRDSIRPDKPRTKNWVCMVEGCAIGEHGTWMHCVEDSHGNAFGGPERWVQDIPCKCNLKDGNGWFALDYEPVETSEN